MAQNVTDPCRVRDWKMFFVPTLKLKGALPCFGEHVLLRQKSLMKQLGTHFELMVQRPANTALWRGSTLSGLRPQHAQTAPGGEAVHLK